MLRTLSIKCLAAVGVWRNGRRQATCTSPHSREGATSRDAVRNRDEWSEELITLKKATKQAGKLLGVTSVQMLDMPDKRMGSMDLLDVVRVIEFDIEKINPEMVVTHHAGDVNTDHRVIHEAVITACRPQPGQ